MKQKIRRLATIACAVIAAAAGAALLDVEHRPGDEGT
jgi:hypothetical protein